MLAIAHELLLLQQANIHLSSFANLERRFRNLISDHCEHEQSRVVIDAAFHTLRGPTLSELFLRSGKRGPFHGPGILGCIAGLSEIFEDYWGWKEDEYLDTYRSCRETLADVRPDLVVIDAFFLPARDAVQNSGANYCLLSTTSLSHIVMGLQSRYSWLWKYPM